MDNINLKIKHIAVRSDGVIQVDYAAPHKFMGITYYKKNMVLISSPLKNGSSMYEMSVVINDELMGRIKKPKYKSSWYKDEWLIMSRWFGMYAEVLFLGCCPKSPTYDPLKIIFSRRNTVHIEDELEYILKFISKLIGMKYTLK